jgi:hypothetical protein
MTDHRHHSNIEMTTTSTSSPLEVVVVDEEEVPAAGAGAAATTTTTSSSTPIATTRVESNGVDVSEIQYAANSFHAIVIPVTMTMILAATAVVYIRTPETAQAAEEALAKQYTVYRNAGQQENKGVALGQSIANGIVIVAVICVMTFVIVLFYKYRCMKCLLGYMVISSAMLLGFLASAMFQVAIDRFQLTIDKVSFYFFMVNFALVGIVAIFAGTILQTHVVPAYVTQGYLILTSVIVAWQLSFLDPWTAWVLLLLLALYDLFAVLSPCGPLKALVKLMSRDDAPEMPGLLYEANLTNHDNNNNNNSSHPHHRASQTTTTTTQQPPPSNPTAAAAADSSVHNSVTTESTTTSDPESSIDYLEQTPPPPPESTLETTDVFLSNHPIEAESSKSSLPPNDGFEESIENAPLDETQQQQEECIGHIPLALAQLYKLRLARGQRQPPWVTEEEDHPNDAATTSSTTTNAYTAAELCALVPAVFSPNGLRIVPITDTVASNGENPSRPSRSDVETRYSVINRDGIQQSVLFVNYLGQPYRIIQDATTTSNGTNNDDNNENRDEPSPTEANFNRGTTTVVEYIPFALAKMYRLRIVTMGPQPAWVNTTIADAELPPYTPAELCMLVPVEFPPGGGRIVPTTTVTRQPRLYVNDVETRYTIIDRDGIHKRILFVNAEGKIFQDMREENAKIEKRERTSIKLGLGDFIFYSILVSKAALYSYTTFVASTLAIVAGLGLTLLLLAMRGHALPALPISILLGVLFFLCTRYVIQPWIEEIFIQDAYV